ncbi:MAG TPA: uroporphyrinogen decarboxylase [Gemmatimonadales bacterium]|nr:uroporphyrinogen decarboxylase [Gemmatimonadales bacterium]
MAVTAALADAPVLKAARGERAGFTPVWFMRQAGRYLPEYRAIRARHSLLEICAEPELAAEVTLQPVRRFGVDAAIIYADILLPIVPMGLDLSFAAGEGPVIANPVRTGNDVERLADVEVEDALGSVLGALRIVRAELPASVALIGFAGAPFTVASYAIEGGSTRQFVETKRFMYGAPEAWHKLMGRIQRVTAAYLAAQVEAGAQMLQVFDSWAGALAADDYRRFVLPHQRALFSALRPLGVPVVHFGVGTGHLLEVLCEAGGDVIGLDWRTPLDEGWRRVGEHRGIQGNLDPAALFAPRSELQRRVDDILRRAAGRPGHIFNLGHGMLPATPTEHVQAVVDLVHEGTAS